jgi:hypothetical protein
LKDATAVADFMGFEWRVQTPPGYSFKVSSKGEAGVKGKGRLGWADV